MIALSLFIGMPAYQATLGLRSAIYFQELVIATGFISWLIRLRSLKIKSVFPSMWMHLLVLVVYIMITTAFGRFRLGMEDEIAIRSTVAALRFGSIALAFLIPCCIPMEQEEFDFYLLVEYAGLIVLLLLAIFHVLRILDLSSYYGRDVAKGTIEYGLLWFNRASLGTLAQIGVFVSLLLMRMGKLPMLLGASSIGGFMWLLLGSFSRSNVLSLAVFLALIVVLTKQKRITNLFLIVILGGVFLSLASFIPAISERLATISGTGAVEKTLGETGRFGGWAVAIKYLANHATAALVGVGFDCWGWTIYKAGGQAAGHNLYLHVLGELGIIGGILYLAFFFRLTWRFFSTLGSGGDAEVIGRLALALLISLLVGSITAELLYPTTSQITCLATVMFLMGLVMSRLNHPSAWPEGRKDRKTTKK